MINSAIRLSNVESITFIYLVNNTTKQVPAITFITIKKIVVQNIHFFAILLLSVCFLFKAAMNQTIKETSMIVKMFQ